MDIRLSACTITKNEEENIKKSIESYREFVDEIIVVDTGSVDDTALVAKKAGAKVFNFEWENDFSAAKNFAIDNCTGDWIIFLDADEWFDKDDAKKIKEAIKNTIKAGYSATSCKLVNFADENEIMEVGCVLRIFKNDKSIRYERAIHEVLFDKESDEPLVSFYTDLLTINHSGYMRKVLEKKAIRNKKLLDKAFALGKATPMDYFYCLRENLNINPEMSDYFYKLINSIPDYRDKISSYNIGALLDDNLFKLVNKLSNKYSFEERLEVLKKAQENFPDNPIFKYYEYSMFVNVNRKRAILALKDAVKLSKDYEKKYPDKVNSFYAKAGDSYVSLGEYELLFGNKTEALEYFSTAVKYESSNTGALLGLLYIIKDQKSEEIILFLNSIYDTNNKEILKFLVDQLRITRFHDVFLYYFVNYNKKFNEVNAALFTSRLITGNYDEIIDTYMNVYNESKDDRALSFVSAAIIAGNRKEKYSEISGSILPVYSKIINAYFDAEDSIDVNDMEYKVALDIFKELAFIVDKDILKKYIGIFKSVGDNLWLNIIKYYLDFYAYDAVLTCIDLLKESGKYGADLETYINYILTNIYFRERNFDKIEDTLDKAISGGYINIELYMICEALEASDEKLDYYYKIFDAYTEMRKLEALDKLTDMKSDNIFFMNIDKFNGEIKNNPIRGVQEQIKDFYNFANKAFNNKAFAYAEKYYKICLMFNYSNANCYYALGQIYNHFNKPDLSYYCYEKAFCEDSMLPRFILPQGHKNYNYVFSKKEEIHNVKCPICGKESRSFATYTHINDCNLTYNYSLISTYMKCEECKHAFLKNELKFLNTIEENIESESSEQKVERGYKIFDEIRKTTEKNKMLVLEYDETFNEISKNLGYEIIKIEDAGSQKFDIIYSGECFSSNYNIKDKLKVVSDKLETDGVFVLDVYDIENLYSKVNDRPYWAKVGIKNIFSRISITKLLDEFGMKVLNTYIDYIEKGKIMVFAVKK